MQKKIKMRNMTESAHSYNLLLVDDDRFLLDMYSMKFTQAGYTVQSCLSAQEAIAALKGGFNADAVVFDVVMPVDDGFALLRHIKEQGLAKNAVLVGLTNESEEEQKRKTEELGASDYIVKAATVPSEVVKRITQAIESHKK